MTSSFCYQYYLLKIFIGYLWNCKKSMKVRITSQSHIPKEQSVQDVLSKIKRRWKQSCFIFLGHIWELTLPRECLPMSYNFKFNNFYFINISFLKPPCTSSQIHSMTQVFFSGFNSFVCRCLCNYWIKPRLLCGILSIFDPSKMCFY